MSCYIAQQGLAVTSPYSNYYITKSILLWVALNCLNQILLFCHIPISQLSKVNPCSALGPSSHQYMPYYIGTFQSPVHALLHWDLPVTSTCLVTLGPSSHQYMPHYIGTLQSPAHASLQWNPPVTSTCLISLGPSSHSWHPIDFLVQT